MSDNIITIPIGEFGRVSGLGLTKIYGLLNSGKLQSITIGRRRLIVMDSYHRLIAEQLGTPSDKPVASPPRPTRDGKAARMACEFAK